MKKKVFSLMMTLLLAFVGVAKAETIEIGTGTSTSYYVPFNSLYGYSFTEQVYSASDIGTAGSITSISFYLGTSNSSVQTNNITLYMKNVARSSFSSTSDYETVTTGDIVYSGSWTIPANYTGWVAITLDTPFAYDGTSNLMVAMHEFTSGYSTRYFTYTSVTNASVQWYSDSYNPDPYNLASYSGSIYTRSYLANAQLEITTSGGGGSGQQLVALQDEQVVDYIYVGERPNGAWMEPFTFQLKNTGAAITVTDIDWTPTEYFTLVEPELPVGMAHNEVIDVKVNTGDAHGNTEWQMVALYGTGRTAAVWTIVAEPYDPAIPDVVELAYDFGTIAAGFSYEGKPAEITPTTLHNDYTLPFPEIEDGEDAVYKFKVESDVILNAYVGDDFPNGKVALYTEDFNGEGGPMATNNYTGLNAGGGGAAASPFEALIGDPNSTSTTGYNPMYYLYNYSLSTAIYTAAELAEAGTTTAPMSSVSWFSNSTYGYNIQNVSIWMANVSDNEVSTMSPLGSGMTLVYQGNHQEVVGENEFVFNQGSFAWDGTSNVIVMVQMNNGSWSSSIQWQSTNPGFNAMSYAYTDNAPYNAQTTSYSMYTSATTRGNILFKANGRSNREVVTYDFENQQIPAGWTNDATYPWTVANGNGGYTIKSGNTGIASSTSTISATFDLATDGTISFDAECMGEGTGTAWDKCIFTLDGAQQFSYGAHVSGWNNYSYPVAAGSHSCTWTYSKDSSVNPTGDYFMIDNVTITTSDPTPGPDPTPTPETTEISAGPVISNLGLTAGTYYLVASATTPMTPRATTPENYTVYINVQNMPCPIIADAEGNTLLNPQPADDEDEVEPASVTLRWMIPEYATGWRLVFGSTYYPDPSHPQTIIYPEDGSFSTQMANSYTVHNLWNNTNYFWHVEFNNDGCPEGVRSPIWGFTTHLNVPQNLTVVDETVFNDEQIVLNWNPVVDRTYRFYNVYRDGELIGNTEVNNIGNTTYTDGPLAYNMNGYVYYVTAVYDEGESAPSNTVTVKVSGRGNVNGHVYEQDGTTGIAGATVTMVGQDEFGVSHTYNFITDGQGYYSGAVYAGTYNGQAAKEGYQTIYEPIQGNPINITYNQTTSPVDYMLDENFDPVCTVIAEYYPDSLDPESPYVKVYWGCGLPGGEIIEDFETGDFSMFDWQVDPTYPWTITTTSPYEGTYCMKSGGAGVANVVSNMTITMDIAADGIMSYFGKISCESNWDYGYFYIDGVQKAQYTGTSNWAEKSFEITAGEHTFQWRYTKDGSVNNNDDCFYVDYITFYKQPEPPQPAQPGWHTYAESDFNNAVGSNVGTSRWAYEYPVSVIGGYAGFTMTKVSLFSDDMYSAVGGNYTCTIYQGGNEPMAGTAVSTITVDVPQNMNSWVDFDLTTPVAVSGTEKLWVVWTANTALSSWPAGCCDGLVEEGTWWNPGIEAGYEWEHETYGTWTMRQYFTNRAGQGFYSYSSSKLVEFPNVVKGAPVMPVKGQENVTTVCANPNAERIGGNNATRHFSHYRVYRTDCYNDGPYTLDNTVVLACELHDTVYIDVSWPDALPGVYKWGVGCVYVGNRGEEIEGPIHWASPVVNRTFTTSEAAQKGPKVTTEVAEQPESRNRDYLQYSTEVFDGGVGTGGGAVYWGIKFPAADLAAYAGQSLTKVGVFMDVDGDYGWTYSGNYTARVYQGGATAPGTLVSETTEYLPGDLAWHDITLTTPVTIDATQDLWLTFYTADIAYPMSGCVYTGNPNSDFLSLDGVDWEHSTDYSLDYTWMIRGFVEAGGPTPPTPPTPGTEGLQEPRESEIVWSNCLDKNMYLSDVDVTVLLNSADSPEGTVVKFTNYNQAEQEMYPVADIVMDGTGYYAFDSFRRGAYKVTVEKEGYEPIEDSINLIDYPSNLINELHLRYVMIEILYGVENVYVSRTGWAMWDDSHNNPGGNGGGGGNSGNGDTFLENCDNGMPAGWTNVDADGDGYVWVSSMTPGNYHNAGVDLTGNGHNGSAQFVLSGSWINQPGQALTPDNYLVSPQVTLAAGSTFSFWACAQDASYPADHFGVAISDNGTSGWTMVNEWTMTAKSTGDMSYGRNGEMRAQGNWYNYSVDLSAYAGQKYIAIRHFNCTDQFILNVDDIELSNGSKNADEMEHFEYYKVMCTSIDGVPIYNHNTVYPFCQLSTNEPYNAPLVEGERYLCKVATVYSTGMSAWSEPVEWMYEPCDHWGPVDEVTVGVNNEGNHIEWVFEHGFNPYGGDTPGPGPGPGPASFEWYYYDNGENVDAIGTNGGNFWWAVMFPAGSYEGHQVSKVSAYDYMAMTGTVSIYQGGTTAPAGSALGQTNVTFTGSEQFVEFNFATPVAIDPAQNVWVVFYNASGATHPAAVCNNTGDANGRWVSLDGTAWADLATYGLDYTFMVRAYIGDGAKSAEYYGASETVSGMVNNDVYVLNITDFATFDERVFVAYNLVNDSRFNVVSEGNGVFTISLDNAYESSSLKEVLIDFLSDCANRFSAMEKEQAAEVTLAYKSNMSAELTNALMMDVYVKSRENNMCEFADPFCTDNGMYEFPAGVNAGSGESGPDYDCLYTTPNPAWYYMQIDQPGEMDIYMYSTPAVDIDFCCWGPFDDPTSPCPNGLTEDKVVSCSYSANPTEHCMIPATAQTGEYYILVITNYSNQACNINFSAVAGSGSTNCGILPPVDIIGFLITQDGEYLAFADATDRDYTVVGEFGEHEYCVRPIYPGEMTLPDHNYGWSMGCPVCEGGQGGEVCNPGEAIHGEALNATDQVKIWWGEQEPVPGPEGDEFTVSFDSGMPEGWTAVDEDGDGFNWMLGSACDGVYLDGGNLAGAGHNNSQDLIVSGSYSNVYGALTPDNWLLTPTVTLSESSVFSFWACGQDASYVAEHFGVAVSEDNGNSFTMVQEWTMTAKSEGNMSIGRNGQTRAQGTWHQYTVDLGAYAGEGRKIAIRHFNCTDMFILDVDDIELGNGAKGMRAGIESYNVYRSTENANYTLIGTVPAVAGQTYYEYIDTPATAGTYYYQVTAVYANCESEPAAAFDNPNVNYVVVGVTGVDENDGMAIFPNPTKGNLTIQANAMQHITVVSVLGQVVYDADVNADEVILNLSQYTAGMYTVRVTTENGVRVERITVVK